MTDQDSTTVADQPDEPQPDQSAQPAEQPARPAAGAPLDQPTGRSRPPWPRMLARLGQRGGPRQ